MARKSGRKAGGARGKKASARRAPKLSDPAQAGLAGVPEAGVPPTRQSGALSATGQAIRQALDLEEIPSGKDRGAPEEQGQDEAEADYWEGAAPKGLQEEPAMFVSNGEVPSNMVASPSGLVPVSTVAASRDQAEEILETRREEHDRYVQARSTQRTKRLSDATVARLGHAELRAIAAQRNYQGIPDGAGNRTMREWFSRQQEEDEALGDEEI